MTAPEVKPDATGGPRKVTIGTVTVTVKPATESLLVSMGLRERRMRDMDDGPEAFEQIVGMIHDAMIALVPSTADHDKIISLIGTGTVPVNKILGKLLGAEDDQLIASNREQRRASAHRRRSGNRRHR